MATSKQKSAFTIERKAVNPSGQLGFLYDGCRDHVVEQSIRSFPEPGVSVSQLPQCYIISGDSEESSNLLRCVGIQDELRLNLLLNLTKRDGISAIVGYSRSINKNTRFFYYSWIAREHQLRKKPEFQEVSRIWNHHNKATHIITTVKTGIDVVVVLQLPSEADIACKIDFCLKNIRDALLKVKDHMLHLSPNENKLLEYICYTTVYSNIPSLRNLHKFSDLLYQINLIKKKTTRYPPLSYTLQTIQSFYPTQPMKAAIFRPLSPDLTHNVERQMLQIRNTMKRLEVPLKEHISKFLSVQIQQVINEAQSQFQQVKQKYMNKIHRLSTLIIDARSDKIDTSKIYQALHVNEELTFDNDLDELARKLPDLETDGCSIAKSQQQELSYWNATKSNLDKTNNRRPTERVSTNNDAFNPVLPPADILKENKPEQLQRLRYKFISKREQDSDLHLINIDSAYSGSELPNIVSLSSSKKNDECNQNQSLPPTFGDFDAVTLPSSRSSTEEIVNILLLGETGVGKSTFINAFANYLTFNSLEKAQSSEPIVIIPVSFTMTTGDNFEEHTIKFGEFDALDNESFNSIGQSVTQHCKSYVFDLNHVNGKKLRIIDTPGFGDTRGLSQDDRNMEHILQYITNLIHLNAICFLLKPNSSRLNVFFRTCLTQLFSLLGPTARKNVIFSFTNARSTFYTPGDTVPLLKTMLNSLSINDIPFEKKNTFCFDSESFRFLVALRNNISFNDEDKHEYETSWSTSVKESIRLIDYVDTKLTVYNMESGWQSIKHAQFEISHMIRPMLEAIRNLIRNIILCRENLPDELIGLCSKPLHRTTTRCCSCKSHPHQVGKFWIIHPDLQADDNDTSMCSCASNQHVPVDYIFECQLLNNSSKCDQNQMNAILNELSQACAEFAHFLMHVACSTKDDLVSNGLEEMIVEETYICKSQKLTHFNKQLVEELIELEKHHKQQMNKMKPNGEKVELRTIYKSIETIIKYPPVHEQMAAVKKTQQIMMEEYEYQPQRI